MLPEIGLYLLIIAMALAFLQSAYLFPNQNLKKNIAATMFAGAWLQALLISFALLILITLRLDNDFSVVNVFLHSNLSLPMLYKIVGAWGNHEGSMLLWVWVLAAYGLAFRMYSSSAHDMQNNLVCAMQSFLSAGFLAFIIFTSNPFTRQFPPPADGQALNPLLQDVALAMHPPLLYLGYVGFSLVFSLAIALLLNPFVLKESRDLQHWAARIHPWIMVAWSCLTLGIGLGSWWAYRELGWGGWWFWDPVENASLLPWLSATALLHANMVLKKRGLLAQWVVVLTIITFAMSLFGTFLVRSGALTSVHGFASDPARGLFILGYMTVLIGGGLLLFAFRGHHLASTEKALPVSREGLIVINNMFVMCALAAVLLGTIYPLIIESINDTKLTVGPAFFNATFLPLMGFALIFTAVAPFLSWKSASLRQALEKMKPAMLATITTIFLCLTLIKTELVLATLGFGLAAWLGSASGLYFWRAPRKKNAMPVFLGHLGAAILIAAMTAVSLWKEETEKTIAVGKSFRFVGYEITYADETQRRDLNHDKKTSLLNVTKDDVFIATLYPEYRLYDIRNMPTSEASIYSGLLYDLYAVIGESSGDNKRTIVRVYYLPMANFLWLGCLVIALGGVWSVFLSRGKYA